MTALHQIIAIEKGVKNRVYAEITELHKAAQKAVLFEGISREYEPKNDDGEKLPAESKKVQMVASKMLARIADLQAEAFDVEAAKDYSNTKARADVVDDMGVIITDAPATFLLYLEKQLSDLKAFVGSMPTLDESEEWAQDPNGPLFRSRETKTHRTRKVQKPIVLYPATAEHPAQTGMITEDVIDGYWRIVRTSGALTVPRKEQLLGRIDKLRDAVKMAREKANSVQADKPDVGERLMAYLFD